ncbi:hypothetical protein HB104_003319 [Escherichia coli]|uniref:hypothetical protein n=1 Tax=Escherichia coli TaxID=562 RepID=UPI000BE3EAA7|nr:hypothetical protein [Escherichia coli]EEZ5320048.1 hypothetical protein [Escherichia coli]EFJ2788440.1 hypothetical protein [Escherichia coli]EFK8884145.1 hypothetical protein [Escherichia coli]EFM4154778.1 hypothetical protein [Escherichia coli]EFM9643403.1 hypothetical protein [Escherichia coli]
MFNLIMRSVDWDVGREMMEVSRVFEFTDDHILMQFKNNNSPDLDKLISLPCLFMQEGVGDELAYIGQINRAKIVGREVSFEYSLDNEVPPITNGFIYGNRMALDMPKDFEFSRNHWAVKDVDLYRFLLRTVRPRRQRPTVFHLSEHENIESILVSVMMPFDAAFNAIYSSIHSAAEQIGLRCRRADDIWENPAIIQDVVALIDRSRIVICDCTGKNPNVFYEAGIAHTLGREVILIAQTESDIPFDLRHLRFIRYYGNAQGIAELTVALQAKMQTIVGH